MLFFYLPHFSESLSILDFFPPPRCRLLVLPCHRCSSDVPFSSSGITTTRSGSTFERGRAESPGQDPQFCQKGAQKAWQGGPGGNKEDGGGRKGAVNSPLFQAKPLTGPIGSSTSQIPLYACAMRRRLVFRTSVVFLYFAGGEFSRAPCGGYTSTLHWG